MAMLSALSIKIDPKFRILVNGLRTRTLHPAKRLRGQSQKRGCRVLQKQFSKSLPWKTELFQNWRKLKHPCPMKQATNELDCKGDRHSINRPRYDWVNSIYSRQ